MVLEVTETGDARIFERQRSHTVSFYARQRRPKTHSLGLRQNDPPRKRSIGQCARARASALRRPNPVAASCCVPATSSTAVPSQARPKSAGTQATPAMRQAWSVPILAVKAASEEKQHQSQRKALLQSFAARLWQRCAPTQAVSTVGVPVGREQEAAEPVKTTLAAHTAAGPRKGGVHGLSAAPGHSRWCAACERRQLMADLALVARQHGKQQSKRTPASLLDGLGFMTSHELTMEQVPSPLASSYPDSLATTLNGNSPQAEAGAPVRSALAQSVLSFGCTPRGTLRFRAKRPAQRLAGLAEAHDIVEGRFCSICQAEKAKTLKPPPDAQSVQREASETMSTLAPPSFPNCPASLLSPRMAARLQSARLAADADLRLHSMLLCSSAAASDTESNHGSLSMSGDDEMMSISNLWRTSAALKVQRVWRQYMQRRRREAWLSLPVEPDMLLEGHAAARAVARGGKAPAEAAEEEHDFGSPFMKTGELTEVYDDAMMKEWQALSGSPSGLRRGVCPGEMLSVCSASTDMLRPSECLTAGTMSARTDERRPSHPNSSRPSSAPFRTPVLADGSPKAKNECSGLDEQYSLKFEDVSPKSGEDTPKSNQSTHSEVRETAEKKRKTQEEALQGLVESVAEGSVRAQVEASVDERKAPEATEDQKAKQPPLEELNEREAALQGLVESVTHGSVRERIEAADDDCAVREADVEAEGSVRAQVEASVDERKAPEATEDQIARQPPLEEPNAREAALQGLVESVTHGSVWERIEAADDDCAVREADVDGRKAQEVALQGLVESVASGNIRAQALAAENEHKEEKLTESEHNAQDSEEPECKVKEEALQGLVESVASGKVRTLLEVTDTERKLQEAATEERKAQEAAEEECKMAQEVAEAQHSVQNVAERECQEQEESKTREAALQGLVQSVVSGKVGAQMVKEVAENKCTEREAALQGLVESVASGTVRSQMMEKPADELAVREMAEERKAQPEAEEEHQAQEAALQGLVASVMSGNVSAQMAEVAESKCEMREAAGEEFGVRELAEEESSAQSAGTYSEFADEAEEEPIRDETCCSEKSPATHSDDKSLATYSELAEESQEEPPKEEEGEDEESIVAVTASAHQSTKQDAKEEDGEEEAEKEEDEKQEDGQDKDEEEEWEEEDEEEEEEEEEEKEDEEEELHKENGSSSKHGNEQKKEVLPEEEEEDRKDEDEQPEEMQERLNDAKEEDEKEEYEKEEDEKKEEEEEEEEQWDEEDQEDQEEEKKVEEEVEEKELQEENSSSSKHGNEQNEEMFPEEEEEEDEEKKENEEKYEKEEEKEKEEKEEEKDKKEVEELQQEKSLSSKHGNEQNEEVLPEEEEAEEEDVEEDEDEKVKKDEKGEEKLQEEKGHSSKQSHELNEALLPEEGKEEKDGKEEKEELQEEWEEEGEEDEEDEEDVADKEDEEDEELQEELQEEEGHNSKRGNEQNEEELSDEEDLSAEVEDLPAEAKEPLAKAKEPPQDSEELPEDKEQEEEEEEEEEELPVEDDWEGLEGLSAPSEKSVEEPFLRAASVEEEGNRSALSEKSSEEPFLKAASIEEELSQKYDQAVTISDEEESDEQEEDEECAHVDRSLSAASVSSSKQRAFMLTAEERTIAGLGTRQSMASSWSAEETASTTVPSASYAMSRKPAAAPHMGLRRQAVKEGARSLSSPELSSDEGLSASERMQKATKRACQELGFDSEDSDPMESVLR